MQKLSPESSLPPSANCAYCFFLSHCQAIMSRQLNISRKTNVNHAIKPEFFYTVHSGLLKAWYLDLAGKERIASFYLPSEVIGFETTDEKKFPYHLTALKDTTICEIPKQALSKLHQEKIVSLDDILALASKRINQGQCVTFSQAEQKVAGFLTEISNRLKKQEFFTLPMSREDIGNYLGLAQETVTRIFSRFAEQKIINVNHKLVHILSTTRLEQVSHFF